MELKSIDTTNDEIEDVSLAGDFPMFKFCGLRLFFCYLVSLLPLVLTIIIPYTSTTIPRKVMIEHSDTYKITTEFNKLDKKSRFVTVSLFFDGFSEEENFTMNGLLTVSKFRKNKEETEKAPIKKRIMDVSPFTMATEEIILFHDENINYQRLKVLVSLDLVGFIPTTATINFTTADYTYDLLDTSIRVTVAFLFLALLIYHLYQVYIKNLSMTYEQNITAYLYLAITIYTDPITAFARQTPYLYRATARAIFYAYMIYYLYSLLLYFPYSKNPSIGLKIFPVIVSVVMFAILMVSEGFLTKRYNSILMPEEYQLVAHPSVLQISCYLSVVIIYAILFIVAISALEETQKNRFWIYTSISLSFVILYGTFAIAREFIQIIKNSSFNTVFPLAIVCMFGLFMFHYHQNATKDYAQIGEIEEDNPNPFGLDDDDQQLETIEEDHNNE